MLYWELKLLGSQPISFCKRLLNKGWGKTDSPLTAAPAPTKIGRNLVQISDYLFQGSSLHNRCLYSFLCSYERFLLFNGNAHDSAGIGILYVTFQMLP